MFGGYNPKNPKNLENAQTDQTSSFQSNYEEMEDQPWTTAQSAVDRCRCRCNEIYDKLKLKLKLSLLDETNETRSKSREENDSNQGFFHFGERCRILGEQTQNDREQIEYLASELNKRNGENEKLERKIHELSSNKLILRDKRRLEEELGICKNEIEDEKLEKEKLLREIDQLRQRASVEDQLRDILRERDEALRQSQALESQIDHANAKAAKLAREKDDAIDEMHAYQLQEKECRNEISRLRRDIDKLRQGATMEDQIRDILSDKEHVLNRMRIQIQASEKELSQLKRERDNSSDENQAYKAQDEEMRNEISNLISERNVARQEVQEYKKQVEDAYIHISKLREKEKSATDQNSKVTLDSEARLSKELGTKLNERNPIIINLSDSNRPTKLAEKYSELYDNEWTDALEQLCYDKMEEEAAIKVLLQILQSSYQLCKDAVSNQIRDVERALSSLDKCTDSTSVVSASVVSASVSKLVKECIKEMRSEVKEILYNEYIKSSASSRFASKMPEYVKKCLSLCWRMVIQDPHVIFGKPAEAGDTFDPNTYKEYTKTGSMVSYTVWLPMILHQNGPLLCKGTVQPIHSKPRQYSERATGRKENGITTTTSHRPATGDTGSTNRQPSNRRHRQFGVQAEKYRE